MKPVTRKKAIRGFDNGRRVYVAHAIAKKRYRCRDCLEFIEIGSEHALLREARRGAFDHHHLHHVCAQNMCLTQEEQIAPHKASERAMSKRLRSRGRNTSRRCDMPTIKLRRLGRAGRFNRRGARAAGIPETTFRRRLNKERNPNTITHADTTKNHYVYLELEDRYTFVLVSRGDPFQVDGDEFRSIVWDYPRQGGNKTKAQISLQYGIPLPILKKILRTYGLYKHSVPYTVEKFEEATDDQLVEMQEETVEKRQYNSFR